MKSISVNSIFLIFLFCIFIYGQTDDIWETTNGPETGYVNVFSRNPMGQLFVATTNGYLYRSTDDGSSWKILYSESSPKYFETIFTPDASTIYGGISGQGMFKSMDGGDSWANISGALQTMYVTAIDTNRLGHLLAGTSSNGIYKSQDSGDSWTLSNNGIELGGEYPRVECFAKSPSGGLYASIQNSGIYKSFDNGDSWTNISTSLTNLKFHDVVFTPNSNLLVSIDGEGIRRTSDDGTTWELANTGLTNVGVLVLKMSPTGELVCGCRNGDVFHSINDGDSWIKIDNDFSQHNITDVIAFGTRILIGTGGDGMFLTQNGGANWVTANKGFNNETIYDIEIDGNSRLYAATNNMIYISDNDGDTWIHKTNGLSSSNINDLSINDNNDYIFAATSWGVCRSEDSGENWSMLNNGLDDATYTAIKVNKNNSLVFVARDSIRVFRSANNGDSWIEASNNLPQSTSYGIIADFAIDNNGYIYAATYDYANPKGIFRSVNNGDYWSQANNGLTNQKVRCIISTNNGFLFAGTQGGGIFRSQDSGSNWENVLDYIYVQSLCSNSAGHIFAGTSNGVYRSVDGGDTWQLFSKGMTDKYALSIMAKNDDRLFAGTYSTSIIRTVGSTTLPEPLLNYPEKDAVSIPVALSLNWQILPQATTYDVQVSTAPDFTSNFLDQNDITENTINVTGLTHYRTYFWHVRSRNSYALSNWSETYSFTTFRAGPILNAPVDNAFNLDVNVNFGWSPVTDAVTYELQLSFDSQFTTTEQVINDLITTSTTIENLAKGKKYFWRVRAVMNDKFSDWSSVYSFTTITSGPVLVYPNDGDNNVSSTVTFSWNSVSDAISYMLQISADQLFSTIDFSFDPINETSYTVNKLNHSQKYYWRVIAHFDGSSSDWSSTYEFTTMRPGPTLLSPANNQTGVVPDLTLNWTNLDNALTYHVQLAANADFSSVIYDYDQINTASYYIGDVGYSNSYFWRVRANYSDGISDWSDVWNFRTELGPISLNDPQDYATDIGFPVILSWNAESSASYYWLQVSTDESFNSSVIDEYDLTSTDYSIDHLDFDTQYFWRVAGRENDSQGEWSITRRFTTIKYLDVVHVQTYLDFPYHDNPGDFSAYDYRLFGIPGSSELNLNQVFDGNYDEQWIAYWDDFEYNNSNNVFVKYAPDDQRFKFYQGIGFWVLNKGRFDLDMNLSSAWLTDDTRAQIDLHEGWNIITDPYTFAVSWDVILQSNDLTDMPLYGFNNGFNTSSILEPYQGYYFDNNANHSELYIPYNTSMAKRANKEGLDWRISIKMTTGKCIDDATWLGIAEKAETGIDKLDYRKPHAVGKISQVYFDRSEWGEKWSCLASDIRPAFTDKAVWDFDADVNKGETVSLAFNGIEDVPANYKVCLIDKNKLKSIDLKLSDEYNYIPSTNHSRFAIVIGTESAVANEIRSIIPEKFVLGNNYPNPFNPETFIPLELPEGTEVTLKIYNLLGEEIRTLHKGYLDTGRHIFKWNGTNQSGQRCPSGVYLYRIEGKQGFKASNKMILMK